MSTDLCRPCVMVSLCLQAFFIFCIYHFVFAALFWFCCFFSLSSSQPHCLNPALPLAHQQIIQSVSGVVVVKLRCTAYKYNSEIY